MAKLPGSSLEAGFGKYSMFIKIPAFGTKCPKYFNGGLFCGFRESATCDGTWCTCTNSTKQGWLFCAPPQHGNIILSVIAWGHFSFISSLFHHTVYLLLRLFIYLIFILPPVPFTIYSIFHSDANLHDLAKPCINLLFTPSSSSLNRTRLNTNPWSTSNESPSPKLIHHCLSFSQHGLHVIMLAASFLCSSFPSRILRGSGVSLL